MGKLLSEDHANVSFLWLLLLPETSSILEREEIRMKCEHGAGTAGLNSSIEAV